MGTGRGAAGGRAAMEDKASSPLIPPPSDIDLEAGGGGEQLQCRICLETDGEGGSAAPARLARAVAGCVFLFVSSY